MNGAMGGVETQKARQGLVQRLGTRPEVPAGG